MTDDVVWLTADEEDYVVAQANEPLDAKGAFRNDRVLVGGAPQAATLENLRANWSGRPTSPPPPTSRRSRRPRSSS